MASRDLLTLYDIPIEVNAKQLCIPSTWKARYALNFKGVAYKTVWIEFSQVESTMRAVGAPSDGRNPDGSPHYTLPVIVDACHTTSSGGPTIVSESWRIAEYLDEAYPAPNTLIPRGTRALQTVYVDHFFTTVMQPCMPILIPEVHARLHEPSRPYYRWISEITMGDALEHLCPLGTKRREEAWVSIQKGFTRFAALLDEKDNEEPLVMGKQITFADLAIAAFLETLLLLHPEEWNARIRMWHGGRWEKLRQTCAKWKNVT